MKLLATIWNGLRAAFLRAPRTGPVDVVPWVFFALIAVYLGVSLLIDAVEIARPWMFLPYGVTTVLTDSLLTLIAAWAIAHLVQRPAIVWGVAALLLAATIATSVAIQWPLRHVAAALFANDRLIGAWLVQLVAQWWWLLVLVVYVSRLAPRRHGRALLAALVGYAISAATWWWLPQLPMMATANVPTPSVTSGGEASREKPVVAEATPSFDAEQVIYNQSTLVDKALAALKPETPGKVDLYVVAFAGDAEENVFRNEVEYAASLFARRFDAEGHVVVLENNPATVDTHPLATLTNLTWVLDGVAAKMNPEEDVLLVYLTTHGSHDHQLLVDLDPLPLDQISPEDLADALNTDPGVRWKVIVVNACYSGGFIDALRDDSTMVITSARADRTSFGCGADSDITYFGKAFLADALNETTSFRTAFDLARKYVSTWEDADNEQHSEPQIASTRSIEAKLDALSKTSKPGTTVPFTPVASSK